MCQVRRRRDRKHPLGSPATKDVHFLHLCSLPCTVKSPAAAGVLSISWALYHQGGFYHPSKGRPFSNDHAVEGGNKALGYCEQFCQSLCQRHSSLGDQGQITAITMAVQRGHWGESWSSLCLFTAFNFKLHEWLKMSAVPSICTSEVGRHPPPSSIWPFSFPRELWVWLAGRRANIPWGFTWSLKDRAVSRPSQWLRNASTAASLPRSAQIQVSRQPYVRQLHCLSQDTVWI